MFNVIIEKLFKIQVGSANTNQLQLFGPSIQPRHCLISFLESVCTVTPLHADALTFVNGHHIQQPTILHVSYSNIEIFTIHLGAVHFDHCTLYKYTGQRLLNFANPLFFVNFIPCMNNGNQLGMQTSNIW